VLLCQTAAFALGFADFFFFDAGFAERDAMGGDFGGVEPSVQTGSSNTACWISGTPCWLLWICAMRKSTGEHAIRLTRSRRSFGVPIARRDHRCRAWISELPSAALRRNQKHEESAADERR
jgi:hypothetical protein